MFHIHTGARRRRVTDRALFPIINADTCLAVSIDANYANCGFIVGIVTDIALYGIV